MRHGAVLLATLFLATFCGCHGTDKSPESVALGWVTTGGSLAVSRALPVDEGGLRLDDAVLACARPGLLQGSTDSGDMNIFVVLQRRLTDHYLPINLVLQDVAGSIRLRPNDHVELVRWDATPLMSAAPASDGRYVISGPLAAQPGTYALEANRQRVDQLPAAGLPQADLTVLIRPGRRAVQRYYLPVPGDQFGRETANQLRVLRRAFLQEGDLLEYTHLHLVPLIQAGLMMDRYERVRRVAEDGRPGEFQKRY